MIEQLTDRTVKNGKAVSGWIAALSELPQNDEGMTTKELADYLGITPDRFLRGTAGLLTPIGEKIENRGRNKIWSTEQCRRLGKQVAAGFRYRAKPKN